MGRQVFTAGEILTAASMNDLGDATVMVFDDATARATAIPTPVEGMVTYLKDTDRVDKFDGTNFVNVDTGGLVDLKTVTRTTPFSASVPQNSSVAITGLSITHEVADPANRLIMTAFCGQVSTSDDFITAMISIAEDGTPLQIGGGTGAGTAGGYLSATTSARATSPISITIVHTPGAGSKTYTVRLHSEGAGKTGFVNRTPRGSSDNTSISALHIMEVTV